MRYLWLLLQTLLALMQLTTGKYVFSALVTLSCALIVLVSGGHEPGRSALMALGLVVSAVGDYLLAHQHGHPERFIAGVAAFGAAHLIFMIYALCAFRFRPLALGFIAVLAAFYAAYLLRSVLPGQAVPMRIALSGYTLVSLMGLFFALCANEATMAQRLLYILGIACIVFSDTMIAEADFVHHRWAHKYILPTYYLCHILLTASVLSAPF